MNNTQPTTQMQAHRHLIRHALQNGWKIQCDDYDDYSDDPKQVVFTNYKQACDYVEAVDGGQDFWIVKEHEVGAKRVLVRIYLAIGYGNEPDETVCDYSVHPFVDEWLTSYCNAYDAGRA